MRYYLAMNVAVRGIIIKVGKLFCVKNTAYNTDKPNEFWCTPGGGVDDGEDLTIALKREIFEELGITAQIGKLLYIQEYFSNSLQKTFLEFFYQITNVSDFDNIDLAKTTHGEAEIAEFDFIDTRQNFVLPKFLSDQNFANIQSQPIQKFDYLK